MNAEWMFDARKIPDEVMNYLRRIAVRAIEEKEVVLKSKWFFTLFD